MTFKNNDVQLSWPMNADGERQLNVGGARRAGDESHRPAQPVTPLFSKRLKDLAQSLSNLRGFDDGDMNGRHKRRKAMSLFIGFQNERARLRDCPLCARQPRVTIEQ